MTSRLASSVSFFISAAVILSSVQPGFAYTAPASAPTTEVHPEVLNLQASFSKVADLVMPAVVSISTTHMEQAPAAQQYYFGDPDQLFQQFFGGQNGRGDDQEDDDNPRAQRGGRVKPQKMEGVGSGVIIDPQGLVLTNEHVVRDADQIKVLLYDKLGNKTEYTGNVVGKDAKTDLAVVRIKVGHALPFAALGNSENVKVGDWAIAIGSPFGLAQTFTVGVISAARQSLVIEDKEYRNLIQTDAAINRGNSGGPLLNIHGEVVGINSAIYAPTGVFAGIGFAVPINQAKAILNELIQKGHVVRGWIGVELGQEISAAMVRAFGLPDASGALINDVLKGSPAEKAGLKRGDVVRKLDGKAIATPSDMQQRISEMPPHRSISVDVIRDRKQQTIAVVLAERPDSADNGSADDSDANAAPSDKSPDQKEWLGAHVVKLTPARAQNFRQPESLVGVIVTDVDDNSAADDIGLVVGDVIRRMNDTATPDIPSFKKAVTKVDLTKGIVLDVVRQGHPIFLSYTKSE